MTALILDGKNLAAKVLEEVKQKISGLAKAPRLSIIRCGDDPASVLYTSLKKKKAEEIGMTAELQIFSEDTPQESIIQYIRHANQKADGIIVQLPLPAHLSTGNIVNSISPEKDVDGLTSLNLGRLAGGDETRAPATPKAVVRLLEEYAIPLIGKRVVIINHSPLIGKPLSMLFLNRKATVTVCHEFTRDIIQHTLSADIIVSATGIPGFLHKQMIKEGVVVVDVGISKKDGVIQGDVAAPVIEKASFLSLVPGGVGPLTVAVLLENLVNVTMASGPQQEAKVK